MNKRLPPATSATLVESKLRCQPLTGASLPFTSTENYTCVSYSKVSTSFRNEFFYFYLNHFFRSDCSKLTEINTFLFMNNFVNQEYVNTLATSIYKETTLPNDFKETFIRLLFKTVFHLIFKTFRERRQRK